MAEFPLKTMKVIALKCVYFSLLAGKQFKA
ncbi:hypothetical protein SAMN05216376_10563 [Mameliella alba]|nr:hypothetical protein SAMN05216376_10563 [Mameliella alba]